MTMRALVLLFAMAIVGCSGSSASSAPSSSGGASGASPRPSSVHVMNLSYTSEGLTDPGTGAPRFGLLIDLTLANDASSPVETLRSFAIDVGSSHAEGTLDCKVVGASWRLATGGRAVWAAELHEKASNGPAAANFPGQSPEGTSIDFAFSPSSPPASFTGDVSLTFKGTLADGTAFTALTDPN